MKNTFRTFIIIMLALYTTMCMMAQRPCLVKMSPLVREACLSANGSGEHGAKALEPKGGRRITAFVKTNGNATDALDDCNILASYGNLHIASIPVSSLTQLSLRPEIMRIEAGCGTKAMMDTTNTIIGSDALHRGLNLPQAYTGKGVVVGVQDIGFDLTHPTFWSQDMTRYRIKAMWDQLSTDTIGSTLPAGRDYRDSLSLLAIGHPRDGLIQTHGTHTAGIAAGSGREGTGQTSKYIGVAPDADICLVCNATSDDNSIIKPEDYYKYTYALDALGFKYIFDYADSVGKPCVINFSEGSYQDFHGDDMLYYEMLDSLTGPGHIIVSAAGNEGGKINYLRKPQGCETAEIQATSQWHANTMSFTTRANTNFKLSLLTSDGTKINSYNFADIVATADSTLRDSTITTGDSLVITISAYPDCYGTGLTVADWVINSNHYIYPNNLTIMLDGTDADIELYANTASLSNSSKTSSPSGDNSHSILSPGSASSVVCVGITGYRTAYTNYLGTLMDWGGPTDGAINLSSSIGPTYDGRTKPDVMAPGQNIVSAYSSYYIENNPNASDVRSDVRHFTYNDRTYAWNSNTGTSMSSPVVAGVIALWLQANPRLTPNDCIDIFAHTCSHYDKSLTYPNNQYGYGQIDAKAGLRYILEKTGIKNIEAKGNSQRIYSIDGKYVGKNSRQLPKGIYIINGKKIVI